MQRYMVLAALLAVLPLAARAGSVPASDNPKSGAQAGPIAFSLKTQDPPIAFKQSPWALPSDSQARLAPDKTAQFVDKMLTVGDGVRLSPSAHSDIDVKPPQGQNSNRGAYLNLKFDW